MAEKARMTFRFDHDAKRRAEGSGTAARSANRVDGGSVQADFTYRKRTESGTGARSEADDIERLERLIREADPRSTSSPQRVPASPPEPADKPARPERAAVFPADDAGSRVGRSGAIRREHADDPEDFPIGGTVPRGFPGEGGLETDAPGAGNDEAAPEGSGAAAETVDAGAFAADPDSLHHVTDAPPVSHTRRVSQRAGGESPSWIRVFLAVAAAIATGAAFGYLMLYLFIGQAVGPAGRPAERDAAAVPSANAGEGTLAEPAASDGIGAGNGATSPQPSPAEADARAEPESPAGADPSAVTGAPETVVIPADLFYLLQFGVFSTEDGMRDAVRAAREHGLAAVSVRDDGYRVFVGVAPTRDDAERLAKQAGDAAVYIKVLEGEPLSLPADRVPNDLPAFFERSGELARQLARLSVAALREEKPVRIGEEEIRAVREAHAAWKQTAGSLVRDGRLAGEAQTLVSAAVAQLDAAFGRLEAFQERPERSELWDVQAAVMEALVALHRLREALQPAGSAILAGGHTEPAGQA